VRLIIALSSVLVAAALLVSGCGQDGGLPGSQKAAELEGAKEGEAAKRVAEALVRAIYAGDINKAVSFYHRFEQEEARADIEDAVAKLRKKGVRLKDIEDSAYEPYAPLLGAPGLLVTVRYRVDRGICQQPFVFRVIDDKLFPKVGALFVDYDGCVRGS